MENWFINLTNKTILKEIIQCIQFGNKFCLPVKNIKNKVETIKDVENNIKKLNPLTKTKVFNKTIRYLNNLLLDNTPFTNFEKTLLNTQNKNYI